MTHEAPQHASEDKCHNDINDDMTTRSEEVAHQQTSEPVTHASTTTLHSTNDDNSDQTTPLTQQHSNTATAGIMDGPFWPQLWQRRRQQR